MCRRLRITPTGFDALPWHYQRLLIEGLQEELEAEAEQAEEHGHGRPRRQKVSAVGDLSGTPFRVTQAGPAPPA